MKKRTMIAALVTVIFYGAMMAQTPAPSYNFKADSGRQNYIMALRSENEGLMTSSMMQVSKIKMLSPGSNYTELKHVIDSLATYGSTSTVRYKAYLASNVCDNPRWFSKNEHARIQDNDEFFISVAARLQERMLGSRAN